MELKELKKSWKGEIVDIALALGVSLIAYFSFNYFKPGAEDMFAMVIFFLVLILLKQK